MAVSAHCTAATGRQLKKALTQSFTRGSCPEAERVNVHGKSPSCALLDLEIGGGFGDTDPVP
jgi:hypothetical protein